MSVQETGAALGRRDDEGRRELPDLRRARSGAGDPLARPDQGRRRTRQRASSACSTPTSRERIAAAADRVADGRVRRPVPDRRLPDRLGHLVNMNANEVIATLAGDGRPPQRPRQHGPVLQRRVPVGRPPGRARHGHERAAAGARAARARPSPAKADGVPRHRQVRAHAPDGRRPGDARPGVRRLRRADPARRPPDPQRAAAGGADPARRHRDRHRAEHAQGVRRPGARAAHRGQQSGDQRPGGSVRGAGQPRRAGRALRRAEGPRRVADQDRQRPRADGLGPARRHRRAVPARAAEGLLDHARQGQPGDPRGRAPGQRAGDRQRHGDHDRRHAGATSSSTSACR